MFVRVITIITAVSAIILSLILTATSPGSAGPFWLLLLFVSAYVTFVGVIAALIYGVRRLAVVILQDMPRSVPLRPLPFRRAYHFAVPLAAACISRCFSDEMRLRVSEKSASLMEPSALWR